MNELSEKELSEVNGGNGETYTPEGLHGQCYHQTYTFKGYSCKKYLIGPGDTLSQIVVSLGGENYNKLARFNNIENPNYIQAGWTIFIPTVPYNA